MVRPPIGPGRSPQAPALQTVSDGKRQGLLGRGLRLGVALAVGLLGCACGPGDAETDAGLDLPGHHDGGDAPTVDGGDDPEPDAPPDAGALPDVDGGPPPDADGGGPVGPEVVRVQGLGLRLLGAGPALVDGCDASCADDDDDGLVDDFEAAVLDAFVPALRLHAEEPLLDDAAAVTAAVGRVTLVQADPLVVRAFIMLGYSEDYGSCGLTAHHGDSERVALELWAVPGGEPGDVEMGRAYTAAHEGTPTDRGRVFAGAELGGLVYQPDPSSGVPRWTVFPSQRKHGTYGTPALCQGAFALPCFAETCADAQSGVLRAVPVVNAGEDGARLVDDLAPLGFEGESAWGDQRFCGGTPEGGCSAPVREKLLVDPFL